MPTGDSTAKVVGNNLVLNNGQIQGMADGSSATHGATVGQTAPATHATQHKTGGTDAIKLNELAAPTATVGFNGQTASNVGSAVAATDAPNYAQLRSINASLVTNSALAAYTYNNGTAGVGATITANGNGAIAAIDGVTPQLNDVILVTTGSALSDNGVYKVTAVGDGSNPFVLTRSTFADTPAKLAGLHVTVLDGNASRTGAPVFACINLASAITIGTSGLVFLRVSVGGSPRLGYSWGTDFDTGQSSMATSLAVPNGSGLSSSIVGTGAAITFNGAAGAGNTDTEIGIITLATGTTTTGSAEVVNLGGAFNWGTNAAIWMSMKVRIPTLSDGTNTFDTHLGTVANFSGGTFATGVFISGNSNANAHWQLMVKAAGATTQASTVTITANQWYHFLVWKDAGTAQIHWAIDGVRQTDPATTNTPTSTLSGPNLDIIKSAGTSSRTLDCDWFAGAYYLPLGRAA